MCVWSVKTIWQSPLPSPHFIERDIPSLLAYQTCAFAIWAISTIESYNFFIPVHCTTEKKYPGSYSFLCIFRLRTNMGQDFFFFFFPYEINIIIKWCSMTGFLRGWLVVSSEKTMLLVTFYLQNLTSIIQQKPGKKCNYLLILTRKCPTTFNSSYIFFFKELIRKHRNLWKVSKLYGGENQNNLPKIRNLNYCIQKYSISFLNSKKALENSEYAPSK